MPLSHVKRPFFLKQTGPTADADGTETTGDYPPVESLLQASGGREPALRSYRLVAAFWEVPTGSRDGAVSNQGAPKEALQQLDQARALVRASLADARTSIWDLRSEAAGTADQPHNQPQDLPSQLSRACTRIAGGSTAKVYLQVKGTYRPVEQKVEEELLRIGQEAVANAVRHAAATRIDVQLIYEAARVSLRVEDDGRGFAPSANGAQGHYGIRGMQERAGEIKAALVLESAPGEGTRVSVEAPLA